MKNFKLFILIMLFAVLQMFGQEGSIVVVNPKSSMVMLGGKYSADIYLAKPIPEGTTLKLENNNNDDEIKVEKNKIIYSTTATNLGMHEFSGKIIVKNNTIPFKSSYIVTKPTASVKTKYLIKDIENPLDVSVVGIPAFLLSVETTNGNLSGSNGNYSIVPKETGICKIIVKAKIKGEEEIIDSFEYNVIEKK